MSSQSLWWSRNKFLKCKLFERTKNCITLQGVTVPDNFSCQSHLFCTKKFYNTFLYHFSFIYIMKLLSPLLEMQVDLHWLCFYSEMMCHGGGLVTSVSNNNNNNNNSSSSNNNTSSSGHNNNNNNSGSKFARCEGCGEPIFDRQVFFT